MDDACHNGRLSTGKMELQQSHTGRKKGTTMRKLAAGVIGGGRVVYFILHSFWN